MWTVAPNRFEMWIQTRGGCWLWWMGVVLAQRSWSFRCVAGHVRMEVWFSALKLCMALLSFLMHTMFRAYITLHLHMWPTHESVCGGWSQTKHTCWKVMNLFCKQKLVGYGYGNVVRTCTKKWVFSCKGNCKHVQICSSLNFLRCMVSSPSLLMGKIF